MLYPQANRHRHLDRLPDFWEFRFDLDDAGLASGWAAGFFDGRPIAVPASWNDLFADGRDDLGPAWYQVRFAAHDLDTSEDVLVHFGSVSYQADVWLNGESLGSHRGGHLPFAFDTAGTIRDGDNLLVVRVDGRLDATTVPGATAPPDGGTGTPEGSLIGRIASFVRSKPSGQVDFFPYSGIHRPVSILRLPKQRLETVQVEADMHGDLAVRLEGGGDLVRVRVEGIDASAEAPMLGGAAAVSMTINDPRLWGIGAPELYSLVVDTIVGDAVVDTYRLEFGFRTIAIEGHQILLNGEPIEIRGFGRHEDFPVHGRGYDPAVMIKDFSLMAWTGANSFRASHYPYCEEQLQLADRLGVLVISEAPAVSTSLKDDGHLDDRLNQWRADLDALVARDRNHPSVVMWSVGNEPMDFEPGSAEIIASMITRVKSLDGTRPVFIESPLSHRDSAFESSDIAALHEYPGWYSDQGELETGLAHTRRKVESLAAQGKPVLITEIGADTIAGHHALPAEMFSEEYQVELVERVMDLVEEIPALVGVQWWNLCDFKTAQGVMRPKALNHKGLFTRDRRPKAAAHAVRARWTSR